jgi:hypothetical protein
LRKIRLQELFLRSDFPAVIRIIEVERRDDPEPRGKKCDDAILSKGMLGLAVAAPLAARAQQSERVRRLGVLMPYAASDPQAQARSEALVHGLQRLGWSDGINIKIDYRWSTGNEDDVRKNADELVALAPDVIFAAGSAGVGQCDTQHARSRLCLCSSPIPSVPASPRAWRSRAATSDRWRRGARASLFDQDQTGRE